MTVIRGPFRLGQKTKIDRVIMFKWWREQCKTPRDGRLLYIEEYDERACFHPFKKLRPMISLMLGRIGTTREEKLNLTLRLPRYCFYETVSSPYNCHVATTKKSEHKLQQLGKNQRMLTSLCFILAQKSTFPEHPVVFFCCPNQPKPDLVTSAVKARDERLSQRKFAGRPRVKGQLPGWYWEITESFSGFFQGPSIVGPPFP